MIEHTGIGVADGGAFGALLRRCMRNMQADFRESTERP
jgi:hypothetical protein